MMKADRDFNQAAADRNMERFLALVAENATSLVAGDVGYTVGTWERHTKDGRGAAIVRRGQYLTVWRKEKDGVWRATFDTGSTSPER